MPLTFNLLAPRTRVGLSDRAAAGLHRLRAPAPLRTFPWPGQPEIHRRLHRLRRADPLLGLPGAQRLLRLRDQIFREHARAHAGTEPRTGCEQLLGQLLGFGVEKHDAVDALVYLIRRRNCATRNPLRLIKGAS